MAGGVGVDRVEFDGRALRALDRQIRLAASAPRRRLLLDSLSQVGAETARARIKSGGPAPDGAAWPERHPRSRSGKPLLNRSGILGDSIASASTARSARWGSNSVYARIHQLGGAVQPRRRRALRWSIGGHPVFSARATIPARPFLGWGADEELQVDAAIRHWLDGVMGGD